MQKPTHDPGHKALHHRDTPIGDAAGKTLPAPEELLMQVFSVLDTPSRPAVRILARNTGWDEEQVRSFFAKQRSRVRHFLHRAQHKAEATSAGGSTSRLQIQPGAASGSAAGSRCNQGLLGPEAGSSSPLPAAISRAAAAREAGLRKLGHLVDGRGGLRDASATTQFYQLMGLADAPVLRCAMLRVLCATKRAGAKLRHHAGFVPMLETWLREAEEDQQTTLLQLLLQILEEIPPAALRSSAGLSKVFSRLQKYRHSAVAASARRVAEQRSVTNSAAAQQPVGVDAAPVADGKAGVAQPGAQDEVADQAQQADGVSAGPATLRKPAATEVPHLMALGRKSLYGKAYTTPTLAQPSEGDGGFSQMPGRSLAIRQVVPSEGEAAVAPDTSPRLGGTPRMSVGALRSLPSGGAARTARPMSVDDIRKAKAKERATAALHSLGAGALAARASRPVGKRMKINEETTRSRGAGPHHQQQQGVGQAHSDDAPSRHSKAREGLQQELQTRPTGGPHSAASFSPAPQSATAATAVHGSLAGSWGGSLHPEAVAAMQAYEQDKERRAALRRRQLVAEYEAIEAATAALPAMWPSLPSFPTPPLMQLPHLDLPVGRGEESTEATAQRARQASIAPVTYPHPSAIPPSPAEAPLQDQAVLPPLTVIPFVSTDPVEAAAQNERLLQDGVRLPQYVHFP